MLLKHKHDNTAVVTQQMSTRFLHHARPTEVISTIGPKELQRAAGQNATRQQEGRLGCNIAHL